MRSCGLAGGTDSPSLLGPQSCPSQLHHPGHLVVREHVLPHDQLVVAQGHLGQRLSLLGLFHELPELHPLVTDLLGEILSDVDVAASKELGLPARRNNIRDFTRETWSVNSKFDMQSVLIVTISNYTYCKHSKYSKCFSVPT